MRTSALLCSLSGMAFVALGRAFVGGSSLVKCRGPPPVAAGIFDDIAAGVEGMASDAAKSVTGMDPKRGKEVIAKATAGNLDFDDFLEALAVMNKMGGAADMASKVPGVDLNKDGKLDEAEAKMSEFKVIIDAMTPEQREDPDEVLKREPAVIEQIAKGCDKDPTEVEKFLDEFLMIKSFFTKMGEGKDMGQITEEVRQEKQELDAEKAAASQSRAGRRAASRKAAKGKGKGGGKTAEWMTL